MLGTPLPEEVQGQWIWKSENPYETESYVFFRREFTLDSSPSLAQLWITVSTFYHIYHKNIF